MDNMRKYELSLSCQFKDKGIEKEFYNFDMERNVKVLGPVTLIFGMIYMMLFISDYYTIKDPFCLKVILSTRLILLVVSAVVYFVTKRIKNYMNVAYLITAYEILAILGFFLIINHYETLTLLVLFSVMMMTLALYIVPNKLIHTQIVSVFLILSFILFEAPYIENMEISILLKVVAYSLIILIFCNIGAYVTHYYKRKQFANSRELLRISTIDSLTGIYNRAKFNDDLHLWIEYCHRYNHPLSLAMLDIDDFKKVNDEYGHLVGDSVLQDMVTTIKKAIRNTDILARWGGEEFVILLPNTDMSQAKEMTERLRICIEADKYDKAENLSITCSFGLVTLGENETLESFLQRADQLLYCAKDCGKNTIIYENKGIREQIKINVEFSDIYSYE